MNWETTIGYLRIAEAIDALELYATISDQRVPSIHCRVWDGVKRLSPGDAELLVKDFNDATHAVRQKWSLRYEDKAQQAFVMKRSVSP